MLNYILKCWVMNWDSVVILHSSFKHGVNQQNLTVLCSINAEGWSALLVVTYSSQLKPFQCIINALQPLLEKDRSFTSNLGANFFLSTDSLPISSNSSPNNAKSNLNMDTGTDLAINPNASFAAIYTQST